MDKLRMQKKEPAGRKNGERRLFSSVNLRMEHIALVEDKRVFNFSRADASMQKLARVTERYALCQLDKPLKSLDFLRSVWPQETANAGPVPGAEAEKTTQV